MNQKGFSQLILVLIIGAVIVVAGGGFWYYKQPAEKNKSAIETQTTSESSPILVALEPSSNETSSISVKQEKQTNQKASSTTPTQNVAPKISTSTNTQTKEVPTQTDEAPLSVPTKPAPAQTAVTPPTSSVPEISCTTPTDTRHMDIFDSHVHANPKVSMSQIISEMDKAGVSVANLYGGTLDTASQYLGRFIIFVDTPGDWLEQGQTFLTSAETQLKTGKFYGIGETNLRYYSGKLVPPPTVYISADTPTWLRLVDLSAQYHVPISFHFVPDDSTANTAFERMLNHNKDATLIWAHLGFNNMPLNSATLNDYLLRYPHLYFDTAGIQNMQQDPAPQANSNWWMLTSRADNGRLNEEWRKFFETWNSRFLFGSDAGGGGNGVERWLNYAGEAVKEGATPNAVGHWRNLLSNLDSNSARNILSSNAKELFLKQQKSPYNYLVSSGGKCYSISIGSKSSVSAMTFNSSTRAITFTVADSNATAGNATITIPIALGTNFTASVDGQSVKSQMTSNATETTISVDFAGGIKSITLSVPQ